MEVLTWRPPVEGAGVRQADAAGGAFKYAACCGGVADAEDKVRPHANDAVDSRPGGKDADYLRGRLQEARWLLSSLELRNRTLLKVSQCIVNNQQGFLAEGEIAMRPLILKEVADTVGVHESTVSRATTRKYMLTPRGVFELKYFFSSFVRTVDGGVISATATKARIQILIENEPTSQPLSDQDISDLLRETGIRAARRTVAKYRESLGIGSSGERRRAYRRTAEF